MAGFKTLIRNAKQKFTTRPTFMALHYLYFGFFLFLGTILLYIPGNMSFVDAIFHSSGAVTQSGLNTIDLNKFNTYQQAVTYVLPFFTTPIFVHTLVVFVRIYWFEKRFEYIVKEARQNQQLRRTISMARRSATGNLDFLERTMSRLRSPEAHPGEKVMDQGASSGLDEKVGGSSTGNGHLEVPSGARIVWDVPPPRADGRVEEEKAEPSRPINFEQSRLSTVANRNSFDTVGEVANESEITRVESRKSRPRSRSRFGGRDISTSRPQSRVGHSESVPPVQAPYLSYTPSVGRNSLFYDLTDEQRNELGGIEYRSLKTLAWILVAYYLILHAIGVCIFLPWILKSPEYIAIVENVGVNKIWWAIYSAMTCFNDLGYTLSPDSFISFQKAALILVIGGLLIVVGNTGFPLFLRFCIWVLWVFCPERYPDKKDELNFLLDHPRRCFTLLFPSRPTWWLFGILVLLNVADIILFLALDVQISVVESIPVGYRIINGFFQAVSTRTSGTASVPLGSLHPGIQCSYLIMMYISVMPLAISIRRTNVYEEHSLGIYIDDTPEVSGGDEGKYIKAHIRRQLEFDLWYVFLGLFVICVAEGKRIADANDYAFTAFGVFFEVVSAYGTVGLSLGYPGLNCSLSGTFSTFSKLVIIAMEFRGRHRGLPYDVDRAILLPSVSAPDENFAPDGSRLPRTLSRQTTFGPVLGPDGSRLRPTISKQTTSGQVPVAE